MALYLEFTAAYTGRRDGSVKPNSGILPGITESEALKVFAGQPAELPQQSKNIQEPRAGAKVFTKFESDLCPLLLDVINALLLTADT